MPEMIETEVKLYVPDLDAVAERIRAAGGTLAAPRAFERNVRYDQPGQPLTGAGIVLRLREDTRVRLTYKGPAERAAEDAVSRQEIEVTVDSFAQMDLILRQLGYAPYVTYEKYRTTYVLDGAEIVLDEMPYGNFVEIEAGEDTIRALLARLELAQHPRMVSSYLELFAHVRQVVGLGMHDLTFAAFEGIDVPPEVFAGPANHDA